MVGIATCAFRLWLFCCSDCSVRQLPALEVCCSRGVLGAGGLAASGTDISAAPPGCGRGFLLSPLLSCSNLLEGSKAHHRLQVMQTLSRWGCFFCQTGTLNHFTMESGASSVQREHPLWHRLAVSLNELSGENALPFPPCQRWLLRSVSCCTITLDMWTAQWKGGGVTSCLLLVWVRCTRPLLTTESCFSTAPTAGSPGLPCCNVF